MTENLHIETGDSFVDSPYVQDITERALVYLKVGYPVHFAGPAGTGKTTLAFHLASQLGRPITLIHGNDEFGTSDLVGANVGFKRHRVVDNYVHSVMRTQEEVRQLWVDDRLTQACVNGETLIYDEFNRSRPEANNVFLSVLGEGILNLPKRRGEEQQSYVEVHPDFHVIFTSNPEEYAGTHKTQDALSDRMIIIDLHHPDRPTEVGIVIAKARLPTEDAEKIVNIVREVRELSPHKLRPTMRSSIAIAKVIAHQKRQVSSKDLFFRKVCYDILQADIARVKRDGDPIENHELDEIIARYC
jgi:gas vesicle protein GvpN